MLTPYIAIDLNNVEKNIETMAKLTQKLGVRVRPHFKTHKCPLIAHKQMEAGAIGITCATLGEAEIAVKSGIKDILISREILGAGKLSRLAGLTRYADVKVVVDDEHQVEELEKTMVEYDAILGVLIEINIGQNRCGMDPDNLDAILSLLKLIDKSTHVQFRGFQGYEGHLVLIEDEEERKVKVLKANQRLMKVVEATKAEGYTAEIVTGGGTGTTLITGSIQGMTEIQPGTYPTMDATYSKTMGHLFLPAVKVVTTVVSKPAPDRVIIDAGSKSISTDYGAPEVIGHPDWVYTSGGDEYGILRRADGQPIEAEIGQEIELYPSHGCTTFNLYDTMYAFRNGKLEMELPIAGRGKSY